MSRSPQVTLAAGPLRDATAQTRFQRLNGYPELGRGKILKPLTRFLTDRATVPTLPTPQTLQRALRSPATASRPRTPRGEPALK